MSKRWLIALAGILMQMMLGTAYAWSVLKNPIHEQNGWTSSQLNVVFILMIFFLGTSAAFGGKFVDKAGVRKVASLAAVLFGSGTLLAGLAIKIDSLLLLYIGYGVIAGIGNGLGYISPVAVLVRWFPDRRGLITGLAVMGFGFGGALISLFAPTLIEYNGIISTFYILGIVYLVVMFISAQVFVNPPSNWMAAYKKNKLDVNFKNSIDLNRAVRMPQFYIMWLVFFVNITSGVALLSNLSPLSQNLFHISAKDAGLLIFFASVFNGLGRVFWSSLSSVIGRKMTFMAIIYSQIPFLFFIPIIDNVWVFAFASCYIVFCMGGGFATMPAFVADVFGSKNMGSIYGKFLLAWSAAGVVGPLLVEFSKGTFGSYSTAFYILAITFLCIYIPLTHYLDPTRPDLEIG